MISIIIPAYNEEKTIAETIRVLQDFFDQQGQDFELVVVSDGSLDQTYEVAKALESERVRVFSYPDNLGKGHALKYGFGQSMGDPVVFFDAGLDFPPQQILDFLERSGDGRQGKKPAEEKSPKEKSSALKTPGPDSKISPESGPKSRTLGNSGSGGSLIDLVIGSKRHPASSVDYPWHRRLVSLGAQMTVKVLFNLSITDTQVGLKVFRREVLEKIMPLVLVKRYAFDIELLALAQRYGFKIVEAPVNLKLKLSTAVSPCSLVKTLTDTLAVFYRLQILKFYDLPEEERKRLLDEYPVTPMDKILCFILGDLFSRDGREKR